jgi:hypothetical protein
MKDLFEIISSLDSVKDQSKIQETLKIQESKWFKNFQYLIQLFEYIIKIYQYKPMINKISKLKIPKNQMDYLFLVPKLMDIKVCLFNSIRTLKTLN